MRFLVLVPWKPVVLVWGLLTAMILIGFTASSLLQGTDHSLGSGAAGSAKTAGAARVRFAAGARSLGPRDARREGPAALTRLVEDDRRTNLGRDTGGAQHGRRGSRARIVSGDSPGRPARGRAVEEREAHGRARDEP